MRPICDDIFCGVTSHTVTCLIYLLLLLARGNCMKVFNIYCFFYFGCICIAFLYLVTMADRKLAFYGAFHYLPPCLVRFKLNVLTEKTGLNNNWRGTLNHQCTIYLTFQLWKYIHLKFYCKDH